MYVGKHRPPTEQSLNVNLKQFLLEQWFELKRLT